MVGSRRRLFIMNAGGAAVVLIFNTFPILAQSQFEVVSIKPSSLKDLSREGNRREIVDTARRSLMMRTLAPICVFDGPVKCWHRPVIDHAERVPSEN
jgi:hypothetical protein